MGARAAQLGRPEQGLGWRGASSPGGPLACPLQCENDMNATDELGKNENDDDLFGGWFEESEPGEVSEEASYEPLRDRRPRAGMVIAAVSATALTIVLVLAGRV